jgi:intracellular septation protein A
MLNSQVAPPSQGVKLNSRQPFIGPLRPIIISALFPIVIYQLASPHMSTLSALTLMAVPPMLYAGYGWVRTQSINPISIITLLTLVVSMLATLLLHDPRLLLIRDSYLTGVFGLLCLISLLFPRPVAFHVYRWAFVRTPEQLASLNANWQVPYGRFVRRLVTVVWGLAFVGEALADTFLAYHVQTAQYIAIHPFLFWGTILATMSWATLYSKHAQKKISVA